MRHKEFWLAMTVGALAGAIAALLYAPQSGVSTRKKIRHGFRDLGDSLEDSATFLKTQAENLGNQAQRLIDFSRGHMSGVSDEDAAAASSFTKDTLQAASKLV